MSDISIMNTNEVHNSERELLEFLVDGNFYALPIEDVKEILPYSKTTPVPNSDERVEGMFMPRDTVMTSINLAKVFNVADSETRDMDLYVVVNEKDGIALHTHGVAGISRVMQENVSRPEIFANVGKIRGLETVQVNGHLTIILNYRQLLQDIKLPDKNNV